MNFKRVAALLLAGAMVMTAVPVYAKGDDVTLSVSIWDTNQEPGIKEILADFTEKTGIKTEISVVKWDEYWTMLEAGAQGGSLPDVFWMHSNESQRYMSNDMLLDLTDKIKDSDLIDPENYPEDIWGLYTYDDKYYAVPKDIDTIALWYNKKMFDDAGLSYPDETWTWDDLYEAAKKLTTGDKYGFCMNTSNDQDTYYNMVYSMGGYIVNDDHTKSGYDDANTIKAMDYVGKLLKDCCPPATTMSETGTDVMFQSGTVAMITQGSWMTAGFLDNEYLVENCDVAILPYDKTTGMRTSICNGLGWAASADTKRPDDCWKLIEWLGSKEMQEKQAELGVTMSAYNNTSDKWVNCTDKFNLNAYLDITKDSTVSGVTNELVLRPYTYNSTVWSQAAQTFFADAWADPSKMEQSCKDFAVQMNQYIDEEDK